MFRLRSERRILVWRLRGENCCRAGLWERWRVWEVIGNIAHYNIIHIVDVQGALSKVSFWLSLNRKTHITSKSSCLMLSSYLATCNRVTVESSPPMHRARDLCRALLGIDVMHITVFVEFKINVWKKPIFILDWFRLCIIASLECGQRKASARNV